jgi:predicted permease
MWDALLHDGRYSLRLLRRSPGFTAVVLFTLMLTVGATAALYSVLNALVFRSLPVSAPDRLALLSLSDPRDGRMRFVYLSPFAAYQNRQKSFETIAPYSGGGLFRTDVRGVQVEAGVETGTPDSFALLGVRPFAGRLTSVADAPTLTEAAPVAVIGHRFWQRQFGGDPRAVGETIRIESVALTVIGVTPPAFHGLQVDGGADVFVPQAIMRQLGGDLTRPHRARNAIGRLRPDVTIAQAQAEAAALWPVVQREAMPGGLSAADQNDLRRARIAVESLATGISSLRLRYGTPVRLLVGFAGILLVIGVVNLSGLFLVRAVARHQQLGVRIALGASRGRLVQQQLVESLTLSLAGTALAMPVAWWICALCERLIGSTARPLALALTPDGHVFLAAAAIAVATSVAIAVLPALITTGGHRVSTSARSIITGTGRPGHALVVAQIALSLTLLSSAGLLVRTLTNLRANDATFPLTRTLFTRLWLNADDHRKHDDPAYYTALVRELSALPGVESVGLSMYFPQFLTIPFPPEVIARAEVPDQSSDVAIRTDIVSPEFFATIGIARRQGRDFTWADTATTPPVAIVNTTLARLLFPAGDVIGRHVRLEQDPSHQAIEIVGVVNDAAVANIREPHGPVAFRPLLQQPQVHVPLVHLRTTADPKVQAEALTRVVGSLGRHFVRTWQLLTLDEQVDQSLLQERLVAGVSVGFASLAVLLAGVGVYGLLAYAAVRRTREIGVRMALGATRGSVLQMFVGQGVTLALVGVLVGLPCALAAGQFTRALLYGLTPGDPANLVIASGVFVVIAAAASWRPASRAASTDPMETLRHD